VGTDGRYLHLRLTDFAEETAEAFDRALDEVTRGGAPRGVILDLRHNPGGPLGVAVRVVDRFIGRGLIVRMQGRTADANRPYHAAVQPNDLPEMPLVVLVDGSSASASEVVAGALQDHRRAVLVGERTFGKFLVQTITEIPGRGAAVKLTTSRYYTPLGRSYQEPTGRSHRSPRGSDPGAEMEPAGLIPDIVVPLDEAAGERLEKYWVDEENRPWGATPLNPDIGPDHVDPQLEQALKLLDGELILKSIEPRRGGPRNG
jgi:hypothetical protein